MLVLLGVAVVLLIVVILLGIHVVCMEATGCL